MKEETKQKLREIREKLKEMKEKAKKYFQTSDLKRKLVKKEREIANEIKLQDELIETYLHRISAAEARIEYLADEIIEKRKKIKQLEKDLKKVQNVIKLE